MSAMTAAPAALLQLLGSSVRALTANHAARPDVAGASFGDLLTRARSGEISSGRECSLDPASGVTLTDEQLARVAPAADRAEMLGARHAGVMIDGRLVTLDVASRRITGEIAPGTAKAGASVDAVVAAEPAPTPALLPTLTLAGGTDSAKPGEVKPPAPAMTPSPLLLRRLRGILG